MSLVMTSVSLASAAAPFRRISRPTWVRVRARVRLRLRVRVRARVRLRLRLRLRVRVRVRVCRPTLVPTTPRTLPEVRARVR